MSTAKKKKSDIWMPFYVADYLANTMHLNTEQHGAYVLLLLASWKSDSKLPNSQDQLQAITRLTPAKWKANESILRAFFHITPEYWIHERVARELENAKKNTEARAISGAKGAKSRWQTNSKIMAKVSQIDDESMDLHLHQ